MLFPLSVIAVVLLVMWLLGMVSGYTLGGLIHIFLLVVLAIAAYAASKRSSSKIPRTGAASKGRTSARAEGVGRSDPHAPAPQREGPSIFLSYRRDDSADVVGRIYDRLVHRFGASHVFKDVDSIGLGVDFREQLRSAVAESRVLIAVLGPSWQGEPNQRGLRRLDDDRDYVRIEIEAALSRNIPVIPVLVRGAVLPSADQLPSNLEPLAFRNGIAVRSDPDFHNDMDRLITGLEKILE